VHLGKWKMESGKSGSACLIFFGVECGNGVKLYSKSTRTRLERFVNAQFKAAAAQITIVRGTHAKATGHQDYFGRSYRGCNR
jgi:hypothetical protein